MVAEAMAVGIPVGEVIARIEVYGAIVVAPDGTTVLTASPAGGGNSSAGRRHVRILTRDIFITYHVPMTDDDRVFKALAHPTRRFLLDRLFERDGRTLTELESKVELTRFGVMQHLRVLEDAGLVVTRRSGREKLHFLNPVPIRLIHDRWIDKYTEGRVAALTDLKADLERKEQP
jgi:DNA-binding transcriptional ArsR family regulator